VRRLLARARIPTMRGAGVGDEQIGRLVELSMADYCLTVNPREWTEDDVRRAYADALALEGR
jgi:alcohol dehydrogenase class IV